MRLLQIGKQKICFFNTRSVGVDKYAYIAFIDKRPFQGSNSYCIII